MHTAELAKLQLDQSAAQTMERELGEIVGYMDILNNVDTNGIEPLSHIFEITNVFRDDIVEPSANREDILKNAPQHSEDAFVVPKTVE